jgi:transcription termination factor Rho
VSVLQRKELEESPLADLHALASELGLEGYRALRKQDLVTAILEAQGGEEKEKVADGDGDGDGDTVEQGDQPQGDGAGSDANRDGERAAGEEDVGDAPAGEVASVETAVDEGEPAEPEAHEAGAAEQERQTETRSGTLDILPNGSGFLRVELFAQARDDVYVSPAQIRRCELRAGDEITGPVRPPRRSERHPSLVHVETVNGDDAEPPAERPRFSDLTPVFARERLSGPPEVDSIPLGKGSRVAVGGPPGAGSTSLLRKIVAALAERHPELELTVVLVGVRPEEVTDWRREVSVPVAGGGFDRSIEAQAQAADLAVERAKRAAEGGKDAAIVVDSLEALPSAAARRLFGAARNTEEAGSVSVFAATGMALEPQRHATTRIQLEPWAQGEQRPVVATGRSGTLRADLLD